MEWITTVVSAALTVIVGALLRYVAKLFGSSKSSFSALHEAQRVALRYQIVQARDYFVDKGNIGKYSLDCIEDMFRCYTDLGGNGFVHDMMDDIRKLPIK